ncbi:MAG: signal recognition particle protein, partial [Janthinobacterium lividum]
LGALAGMIPGMAKAKQALANGAVDEKVLGRMEAVICSMTPKERARPDVINAKRKIRIAKGAGTTVQEVNKLMKMHQEMEGAMKRLKKMGGMKGMAAMLGKMGGGAGGVAGLAGMLGGGGQGGLPSNFNKFNKR